MRLCFFLTLPLFCAAKSIANLDCDVIQESIFSNVNFSSPGKDRGRRGVIYDYMPYQDVTNLINNLQGTNYANKYTRAFLAGKPTLPLKYYITKANRQQARNGNQNQVNNVYSSIGFSIDHFSINNCYDDQAKQTILENTVHAAIQYIETNVNGVRFQEVTSIEDIDDRTIIIGAIRPYNSGNQPLGWNPSNNVQDCQVGCFVKQIGMLNPDNKFTENGNTYPPFSYQYYNFLHAGICYNNFGSILHELGHKLGFFHEQFTDDRNDYLSVDTSSKVAPAWLGPFYPPTSSPHYLSGTSQWYWQWNFAGLDQDPYRFSYLRLQSIDYINSTTPFDPCSNQMYPVKESSLWASTTVQLTAAGRAAMQECMRADFDNGLGIWEENEVEDCENDPTDCDKYTGQRKGLSSKDIETYDLNYPFNDRAWPTASPADRLNINNQQRPTPPPNADLSFVEPIRQEALGTPDSSSNDNESDTDILLFILPPVGGLILIGIVIYCVTRKQQSVGGELNLMAESFI